MSFSKLRRKMVDEQIKRRGVNDERVMNVMSEIPREFFVPDSLKTLSYDDSPVPIGGGQTISQPYIVAKMTELLDVQKNHIVLEIGTGSGYQAAILAKLSLRVFSIERITELRKSAETTLKKLKIENAFIINGDGTIGLSQYAPFDRIIVTAAGPNIPKNLLDQLKDNGIIVMPVGNTQQQVLIKAVKKDGKFEIEEHDWCRFVPLIGKYGFSDIGV